MPIEYYFKLLSALCILGAMLFGLHQLSIRIQKKKYSGEIQIIDRKPLDAQNTILLLKVRQQEYLLGVNGKQMHVLEKL